MCFVPTPKDPELPPEPQILKNPDNGRSVSAAQRRSTDKVRAYSSTVLTGGQGDTTATVSDKKTLLGQ